MRDLDRLCVRRPAPAVRLVGVGLLLASLIVLAHCLILVLDSGPVLAIAGWCGIVGSAFSLRLAALLVLLRWETVLDRRSRTVTRRSRLIATIAEKSHGFSDFQAIELRRFKGTQPDLPSPFAIVLVGPDATLDIDDPGPVPSAALFWLLARLAACYDSPGRAALASALVEFTGLKLRDCTGWADRPTSADRPPYAVEWLSSVDPVLEIQRVPRGARVAALALVCAGTAAIFLGVQAMPVGKGLPAARATVDLVAMAVLPLAGALALSYRSRVVIDFPSRLVRRQGSFLGSRWDESYDFDQFEAVFVRELKIRPRGSTYRSVGLSGGRFEITLYDDRGVPRTFSGRVAGQDRGERCLATAEALAALCGLPIRVIGPKDERAAEDHDPARPGSPGGLARGPAEGSDAGGNH